MRKASYPCSNPPQHYRVRFSDSQPPVLATLAASGVLPAGEGGRLAFDQNLYLMQLNPTFGIVTQPAHGVVSVNPDKSLTYTPDAPAAGQQPFVGWEEFTYSAHPQGMGVVQQRMRLTLAVPNGDPPQLDAPESYWNRRPFDGTLVDLSSTLSQVDGVRNQVVKKLAALGDLWQQVSDATDLSADHIMPLIDQAIEKRTEVLDAYETYQAGWFDLLGRAATYQATYSAYLDNAWDSDTYSDIFLRINALPRDIGGLRPQADVLAQLTHAFTQYGDAAAFQVSVAGTVATTANITHKVLDTVSTVGLYTVGAPISLVAVTTRAGFTQLAKVIARKFAVDQVVQLAAEPVISVAIGLAVQAGVSPTAVTIGAAALQATALFKGIKPLVSTAGRWFRAPLSYVTNRSLEFPRVKMYSRKFILRTSDEAAVLRTEFESADGPRERFRKWLVADDQRVSQLISAGIDDAGITNFRLGKGVKGFDIHHKDPLKFGGTNEFDNLILMQTGSRRGTSINFHGALTNYQESISRYLPSYNAEAFECMWPSFDGFVYSSLPSR